MRLSELVTGPTKDAVSLEEIKSFCRVPLTDTDHDSFLARLNEENTLWLEKTLGICCQEQTWKASFDFPPECGYIQLSMGPLLSVEKFRYYTLDNNVHDFNSSDYFIITGKRSSIELVNGIYWPSYLRYRSSIYIEWKAGFDITPPEIRLAIKQLVRFEFNAGGGEIEQIGVNQAAMVFRSDLISTLSFYNRNLGFDPPEYG